MSKQDRRERKQFAHWWILILILTIISVPILWTLHWYGVLGNVVVSRVAFEQSYQYEQSQREAIATFEASLAEIETRLSDPDLPDAQRQQLESRRAGLRIQLKAARRQ